MLAPQYDQYLRKIELGKGKSEKPLPPSTPCPLPATDDPVTSPPTRQATHVKTVNGHVFFVSLVFTLFVKCCQAFLFEKLMENIVFLEGIRGKRVLPAVPTSSAPPQINENTRVTERRRLRAAIFPEQQHRRSFSTAGNYRLFGPLPFREWIRSTWLRCAAFPGKDADWKSSPRRDSDARSAENLFCW
jgi:hypothetical protein